MGRRKYPPLTPAEVRQILTTLGFTHKSTRGSHEQWEGISASTKERTIVTVDAAVSDFWPEIIKNMIDQAGCSRETFYGATRATKKKI